jgi:hypothetical protein
MTFKIIPVERKQPIQISILEKLAVCFLSLVINLRRCCNPGRHPGRRPVVEAVSSVVHRHKFPHQEGRYRNMARSAIIRARIMSKLRSC